MTHAEQADDDSSPTDSSSATDSTALGAAPIYRGHMVEGGLFASVHSWHDLFPALRLLKTARVLASPIWVGIATLVFSLWQLGIERFVGDLVGSSALATAILVSPSEMIFAWIGSGTHFDAPEMLRPFVASANGFAAVTLLVVWTLLVWTPFALSFLHLGGHLTSGRDLPRTRPTLVASVRKTPRAWIASVVPALASLPFLILSWLVCWPYLSLFGGPETSFSIMDLVAGLLIAGLTLPAAILLGFSKAAIPLSWAAISIEDGADALDALSRGYEYCLRRLVYAAFLITVVLLLLLATSHGFNWFCSTLLALIPVQAVPRSVPGILSVVTNASLIALSWSLIGGSYLLLRQSAGGQEIDDIPEVPVAPMPAVPSVQRPT
ncbi:MAG: hypothetical protein AAGD07_00940 [Planctomycetota bacterium]